MRRAVLCLTLAACGRIGFDQRAATGDAHADSARGDTATADTAAEAALVDAPKTGSGSGAIAHVGPSVARHPGAGSSDSFTIQASAAGNLVLLQVDCSSGLAPASVSVGAFGWDFQQVDAVTGGSGLFAATFSAIAPGTVPATVDVIWSGSPCDSGKAELGDEFANVGSIDNNAETVGNGAACGGGVGTNHADDAVWGACFTQTDLTAVGPGYTIGADDGGGDWSEYKLTSDPSGTLETVTFSNDSAPYVLSVVALAP